MFHFELVKYPVLKYLQTKFAFIYLFFRLAINVTKDLDVVRLAHRTPGAKVPLFHYEMKDFSIIKSFTELTDNDLELVILRGINYNAANPKDVDTYVKFTFPFPQVNMSFLKLLLIH